MSLTAEVRIIYSQEEVKSPGSSTAGNISTGSLWSEQTILSLLAGWSRRSYSVQLSHSFFSQDGAEGMDGAAVSRSLSRTLPHPELHKSGQMWNQCHSIILYIPQIRNRLDSYPTRIKYPRKFYPTRINPRGINFPRIFYPG